MPRFGKAAGLLCRRLGSLSHQQSAASQLSGSASGGWPAVIRVMGGIWPCVSLHAAGQSQLVHTTAGKGAKRTRESMQDLLRLGLRKGPATSTTFCHTGWSKSQGQPRSKESRETTKLCWWERDVFSTEPGAVAHMFNSGTRSGRQRQADL